MSGKRVGEVDNAETSKRFRSAVDESLTHLVCAITQELPLDPVTAEDGNIYELGYRGVAQAAAEKPDD